MIYGYARVSTLAQDLASQLAQLKAAGCEKVFRETPTLLQCGLFLAAGVLGSAAHSDRQLEGSRRKVRSEAER